MDLARHAVAILAIVCYPPVCLFWFLVHPFARQWRQLGATPTYTLTLAIILAVGGALWWWRETLVSVDLGTQTGLVVLSALLMAGGLIVELGCRRQLTLKTLVGIPELRAEAPGELLCEGAYARVRHPRYTGAILGLLSVACFANHAGTWTLAAAGVPVFYVLTVLEERELVERFGDRYRDYQRRVPRFLPRRRRGGGRR